MLLQSLGTMTPKEKALYYLRCAKAESLLEHRLNEKQAIYIAQRTKQGEQCQLKELKALATKDLPPTTPPQADLGL